MLVAARGLVPQQAHLEPSKPKQVCVPLGKHTYFCHYHGKIQAVL